jgi:uncharacterized protein
MIKTLKRLKSENKIHPPEWLIGNILYLCETGSVAYGMNTDHSDIDVYGYAMPLKEVVFPHKFGCIHGFDVPQGYEQWQEHHCKDNTKEYDFTVFSLIKFFRLVVDNNPNIIGALFSPRRCILHSTQISELIRENRSLFLHKGAFSKYKGYAYSQMSKMRSKKPLPESKRFEIVEKYGFDLKFSAHAVRLLSEIEQIMTEHTLVLDQDGRRQQLKAIRNGEWSYDTVIQYVSDKEKQLEEVYLKCGLPYSAADNMPKIKKLLMTCLEMWYEDTAKLITNESQSEAERKLAAIKEILNTS